MNKQCRVAIVTNIVADYRYPIFAQLTASQEFELKIFLSEPIARSCELAQRNLPLHHSRSVRVTFATSHGPSGAKQHEPLAIPFNLFVELFRFKPEVIVAGDWGVRTLLCWCAAALMRVPLVIWSEDIPSSAANRSKLQHYLRRFFSRHTRAVLAWGQPAVSYALSIGVPPARVFHCPQAIDIDRWMAFASRLDRCLLRSNLNIHGSMFLVVARLIQRKGVMNLLKAWQRLGDATHSHSLVIVGTGDEEPSLKDFAVRAALRNVSFAGFQSGESLATYYAAADVLVLPSLEDVWGLSANEALCFGVPVIASQFAGAHQLVAERGVGVVIDPTNVEEFAAELRRWIESPPSISPECCRRAVADSDYATAVTSIKDMLRLITNADEHMCHA